MLVLSRKVGQEIYVGDDVKLTVVKLEGNSIRIGIEAPQHVRILRGELADGFEFSDSENEVHQAELLAC